MAKKKSSSKSKNKTPDFEVSLGELESIVAELESGSLPLAEAIARYEDGVKLLKECHGSLNSVQRRIELLTKIDEDGSEETTAFNAGTVADVGSTDGDSDESDDGRLF